MSNRRENSTFDIRSGSTVLSVKEGNVGRRANLCHSSSSFSSSCTVSGRNGTESDVERSPSKHGVSTVVFFAVEGILSSRDLYSTEQRRGISTAVQYTRGQMVAVRYQSHWYRARVLEFKPATNFAWVSGSLSRERNRGVQWHLSQVQFVDQGDTRELGTNTMRPIHHKFLDLPLQAYLCRLDGFEENFSWSTQDKDLFKKKIRDKILYAKKVRGKTRTVELVLIDGLWKLDLEPNLVQLVDLVEGELVSFESFWHTLHHTSKPAATPSRPVTSSNVRQAHPSPPGVVAPPNPEPPVRHLQPIIPGLVSYASGSEYSQTSSMMKKPSGAMVPPPPLPAATRQPMQFISAGFKQPVEYTHASPAEQLAQFQQQEGHRIQPTTGYSISKHLRAQR